MKITDYLKPDWKKSSEEVRLNYIANLDANDNLVKIVAKILNQEKIPKLRKLAIEKIENEEKLIEVLAATSEENVKLEIKTSLIAVIKKNYIANRLKDEKYLDFLEQSDFSDLLFQVKNFNQKKKLINKVTPLKNLLKILEKIPESEKDVIKFIITRLSGQEELVPLLEDSEWERIAKKFRKEIVEALRQSDDLFSTYKNKILQEQETKVLTFVENEIIALEILPDSFKKKVEEKYCLFGEKLPLSSSLVEKVNHYEKLYLAKQEKEKYQNALSRASDFFHQQKETIKYFENNFLSNFEETNEKINQELNILENFYNNLQEDLKEQAVVKNNFLENLNELKKLQETFLKKQQEKEKLQAEEREKTKTINELIEQANNYLKRLDQEETDSLLAEITTFQKEKNDALSNSDYQNLDNFLLWEKSMSELTKKVKKKKEAIFLAENQEKKLEKLQELKVFFVGLDLADKELVSENLKAKLKEWDDLLNENYTKLDNQELASHKKIILETKKEIEEKEFREIQSYLDKKESLCKVLEGLLALEDQKQILEALFEVNKKWHRIPLIDNFYFKESQNRYFALKKKCEEKTKAIYDDFQKEQEAKINRKKELLTELKAISDNKSIEKKTILEVDKILVEWKSIYIYTHFNDRELNATFKDKLNFFHKQKKSIQLEMRELQRRNLEEKKAIITTLPKLLEGKKDFKDKIILLKEQRNLWLRIKAGYPFLENQKLDKEFFDFLEKELTKNSQPLEKRIDALKLKKEQIEKLLEREPASTKELQERLNLFNNFFKSLQNSFLPQKDYNFYKEAVEKLKKEFMAKNQSSLELLKEAKEKALAHKKTILEKIIAINDKKSFTKEDNQEVKKLYQEWNELEYIPPRLSPDLEIDFKKNVNLFYKNLRENLKGQKENFKNNFLIKKKLLDRLNYLIGLDVDKKLTANAEFDPSQLKDIWEYNRQFKHKKDEGEKRKEVFSLLKEWNNQLALDYQDRKKLNSRFGEIKKQLRKKGYFS